MQSRSCLINQIRMKNPNLLQKARLKKLFRNALRRCVKEHDKVLKAEKERADKAEAYAEKFKKSVVQSQIVQAAVELEALPEATPDIAFLAQTKFALDENGKAVAVDENGDVVIGKDGQTPMTPKEWVESLREQNRITGLNLMAWAHLVATIQKVSQTFSKPMAR